MTVELIQGDCLTELPKLPADHFHCVVTSPPYFLLRSYLPADHELKPQEIGSEPTPEAFIETMVKVFREVRRVLHPTGLLFLNMGTTYASDGKRSNPFRPSSRGVACDTDDKEQQGSIEPDSSCSHPDDARRDSSESHRSRTDRPLRESPSPHDKKDHDNEQADSVSKAPCATTHDVPSSKAPSSSCYAEDASSPSARGEASPLASGSDSPAIFSTVHTDEHRGTCDTSPLFGPSVSRTTDKVFSDSASSSPEQEASALTSLYSSIASRELQAGSDLGIPFLVALALQADGWLLRQTIIFAKKSAMPESVRGWRWERCRVKVEGVKRRQARAAGHSDVSRMQDHSGNDLYGSAQYTPCPGCPKCEKHGGYVLRKGKGRCTTAHEYVFVFSKESLYFWDSAAFVEARGDSNRNRWAAMQKHAGERGMPTNGAAQSESPYFSQNKYRGVPGVGTTWVTHLGGRNPRSVWLLSSEGTSVAHFATYPTELVRRCLQAGTSDGGCCPECSEPWAPVVESEQLKRERPADRTAYHEKPTGGNSCGNTVAGVETRLLGYRPTCECFTDQLRANDFRPITTFESIPCRVLDPFAGIGTTVQVAHWMGRDATGIELNPEYAEIAQKQIEQKPRCLIRPGEKKRPPDAKGQQRLFT